MQNKPLLPSQRLAEHDDHGGLFQDFARIQALQADRRRALQWLGAGAMASVPLLGCGGGSTSATSITTTGSVTAGYNAALQVAI